MNIIIEYDGSKEISQNIYCFRKVQKLSDDGEIICKIDELIDEQHHHDIKAVIKRLAQHFNISINKIVHCDPSDISHSEITTDRLGFRIV